MKPIRLTKGLLQGTPVNQECPCGSGIKYKKCCKVLLDYRDRRSGDESVEVKELGIYISKSAIIKWTPNYDELLSEVKQLPFYYSLRVACALNHLLYKAGGQENSGQQLKFIQDCFDDYWLSKCFFMYERNQRSVLMSDMTVLSLIRLIILHADRALSKPIDGMGKKIGLTCLMINDFLSHAGKQLENFEIDIIRQAYLKNSSPPINQLVIGLKLSCELPMMEEFGPSKNPDYIDIESVFCHATGFDVKDYYMLLFACISQYYTMDEYKPLPFSTFFSQMKLPKETVDRFWKLISLDSKDYKHLLEKDHAKIGDKTSSTNFAFSKYPLIIDNDHVFGVDSELLHNKFIWGVYWIIVDCLNEQGDREGSDKYIRHWGRMYEELCSQMLLSCIPEESVERCVRAKISPEEKNEIDVLVVLNRTVLFFEITKSIPPIDVMAEPVDQTYRDWLSRTILDKYLQLGASIDLFATGELDTKVVEQNIDELFPIIVTPFSIPQNHYMFTRFYKDATEELISHDGRIKHPIMLSTDELIKLLSVAEQEGVDKMLNVVRSKVEEPNKFITFNNHLCFNYQDSFGLSIEYMRSSKLMDEIIERAAKCLTGSKTSDGVR